MASTFHHVFEFDNTTLETDAGVSSPATLQYCSINVNTNDCVASGGTLYAGTTLDKFGICPIDSIGASAARYNVSKSFVVPSQAKDFVFAAVCTVCDCQMSLEMSPDNVNWCPIVDSSGKAIHYTDTNTDNPGSMNCSSTTGSCTTQIINTAMLQYVRVVVHDGASTGGKCVATLHWTTF